MCQRPTVELVGFPSIFVSAEALSSFTRGLDSAGASIIRAARVGLQMAAIETNATGSPGESSLISEHLQACDAGLEGT